MAEIKPDIETFAKIKVIGVGGGGNAVVNRMIGAKIHGVEFLAINTDVQALHSSIAPVKLHIGKTVTRGLGAGMNPELGRRAAEESQNEIRDILKGADMVFITCGLGGGTGSGASPIVAEIARDLGALTIAVVTKPFSFEGIKRTEIAKQALEELSKKVDAIIIIPNDKLLKVIDKKTSLLDAFSVSDNVLLHGVQGIAEVITVPALINLDFADVKAIMSETGSSLMGLGKATGENRATEAAKSAIESSLLDLSIDGAKGILFTITGGSDLTLHEVNEAAEIITKSSNPKAKIIVGASVDENLKDTVKITVVATGFGDSQSPINKDEVLDENKNFMAENFSINSENNSQDNEEFSKKEDDDIFANSNKGENNENEVVDENKKTDDVDNNMNNSDDDELDIPAFLRKKMFL
ncbi:MAG: cell division protein FtsZ [Patescibacteria group bacterium]|nr:cell division protein FtsZ [Patescibacteria group bacterium]